MVFWCTLSFCHISDKFDINVMKNLSDCDFGAVTLLL